MTADELKKLVGSSDFYDRYDKAKHWDFLPVMAKHAMQSAEFNEIQHIAEEKVKALGNSLYSERSQCRKHTCRYLGKVKEPH